MVWYTPVNYSITYSTRFTCFNNTYTLQSSTISNTLEAKYLVQISLTMLVLNIKIAPVYPENLIYIMNKKIFEFNTEIYCYCDYMCIFDVLLKNILIFESIKNNTTEYKIISGDFFFI